MVALRFSICLSVRTFTGRVGTGDSDEITREPGGGCGERAGSVLRRSGRGFSCRKWMGEPSCAAALALALAAVDDAAGTTGAPYV